MTLSAMVARLNKLLESVLFSFSVCHLSGDIAAGRKGHGVFEPRLVEHKQAVGFARDDAADLRPW